MMKDKINVFTNDIKVPQIVQEKANIAFSTIKEKGTVNKMDHKNSKIVKFIAPFIAVAACATLIIIGNNITKSTSDNHPNSTEITNNGQSDLQQQNNTFKIFPDFTITAYAAERHNTNSENIIFQNIGISDSGYTGMLFQIEGEEITDVDISIDKGELYSTTIEKSTEDALNDWLAQGMPDLDNNPNTYTILKPDEFEQEENKTNLKSVSLYNCIKEGNKITEKYDNNKYYGFYIPDDISSNISDENDLAIEAQKMLNIFDNSVLTISATFADGSTVSKVYDLSIKKSLLDENGLITQEEWGSENEGAYVYGILVNERK